MIDILAYCLITFFIFITSLAIIDIKARNENKPDTRIDEHKEMLVNSFDPGHEKKNESHDIDTENTQEKTDIKSEHIIAPEKTDIKTATDENTTAKEENTLPETNNAPDKAEQIQEAEDNDLEKLINLFEQEAGKAKKSHEPLKLPNESLTNEPPKPSKNNNQE